MSEEQATKRLSDLVEDVIRRALEPNVCDRDALTASDIQTLAETLIRLRSEGH